jgi:hypothetical protein
MTHCEAHRFGIRHTTVAHLRTEDFKRPMNPSRLTYPRSPIRKISDDEKSPHLKAAELINATEPSFHLKLQASKEATRCLFNGNPANQHSFLIDGNDISRSLDILMSARAFGPSYALLLCTGRHRCFLTKPDHQLKPSGLPCSKTCDCF